MKFDGKAGETVDIVVLDSEGRQVATDSVSAKAGSNTWKWDGASGAGATQPDGAYRVSVLRRDAAGTVSAVPTTIVGTVTSVDSTGAAVKVHMGGLTVDFDALRSLTS